MQRSKLIPKEEKMTNILTSDVQTYVRELISKEFGSSMIITTGVGPFIFGFPVLGVIGYLISTVMGLWLVVTILRAKKY